MAHFPDPRFYDTAAAISSADVAAMVGGTFSSNEQGPLIARVSNIENAGDDSLVFVSRRSFLTDSLKSQAGALLIADKFRDEIGEPDDKRIIFCASPRAGFATLAGHLHLSRFEQHPPDGGIDPSAEIGERCHISSGASIGANAVIGNDCVIGPFAVIGQGVELGDGCHIGSGAIISHAILGRQCRIRAGVVIGDSGFGFVPTEKGMQYVPQLGRVIIGDEVDIGANSAVDRGALGDTRIGQGTKIDNLVQIAHNVSIGKNCAIAALCGISGSAKIGDDVLFGGQAGVADHASVGSNSIVSGRSAVLDDLPGNGQFGGAPAKPLREWMREVIAVSRLAKENRQKK